MHNNSRAVTAIVTSLYMRNSASITGVSATGVTVVFRITNTILQIYYNCAAIVVDIAVRESDVAKAITIARVQTIVVDQISPTTTTVNTNFPADVANTLVFQWL